jgi:hypothetical protein
MAWTTAQRGAILDSYWKTGTAKCPDCGSRLQPRLIEAFGQGYAVLVECPLGHDNVQLDKNDDPLLSTFREWTPQERIQVIKDILQTGHANCPIDSTSLEVNNTRVLGGGSHIRAICKRCKEGCEESIPPVT